MKAFKGARGAGCAVPRHRLHSAVPPATGAVPGSTGPSTVAPAEPRGAGLVLQVSVMQGGETPPRDNKPGRGRLHRSPKIPQRVTTRRCLCAEIKVSCAVAGKCKCSLNKLLIVKPHYLGVIITGTPCTAKTRPRACQAWAPQEEDVSCSWAESDEKEQAEMWERRLGKESGKGGAPGEHLWWAGAQVPRGAHGKGVPGWRGRWWGWRERSWR